MQPGQPQAANSASPQITAASFPTISVPASARPPPGMSLLDQFPSVRASVLLDIARHEFEPSDLYKLDSRYRDKAERSVIDLSGGTLAVRATSTKDYPTFNSVFPPLGLYFQILVTFVGTAQDPELSTYVSRVTFEYLIQLQALHEEYQWPAVLAYHMEFHHCRLREMARGDYSGWGDIDGKLQRKHLFNKDRFRPGATPQALARSGGSKATPGTIRKTPYLNYGG
ncbi:hypothetical protein FOMPIDRAFT_1137342 [Fomitopsis schrenkii]|uniref:Uncharacterized protein n=1 Tax=Fomitopsis schrenkii TaxID=2126942 RepID=S8DIV1_FOMSC|nr:hypothetical protein FOMPIDRAFT_1137342 [Fomitopsis schrenkii]